MIDNIGYIISSHVRYGEALEHLLSTMTHIDPKYIKVVVGGAESRYEDGNRIYVPHNSYDYNGLIDFVEYRWPLASHVICLHDTMELSPNTDTYLRRVNPEHYGTAAFGGQCNLVTYRADYLFAHKDYILSMKNCSKLQAIAHEGTLYRMIPEGHAGSYRSNCIVIRKEAIYGGAERIREYYDTIGVYKLKANWGQTNPSNYILEV